MRVTTDRRLLDGTPIWPVGLGGASWSLTTDVDEARSIRTVHAALDAGIQLIDTARAYTTDSASAHNEELIAKALAGRSEHTIVATKGGHFRIDRDRWGIDGSPAALRRDCLASLRALGIQTVDLYFLHKPDPDVSLADSVGALHDLREEGLVAHIGISNVDEEQLEECLAVTRIDAVQNRFSAFGPNDDGVLAVCERLTIPFIAYSPLRGMPGADTQFAQHARAAGVSSHRLAIAWLLRRSAVLVPIVGASRPESAIDSAGAPTVELSDSEWDAIDRIAGLGHM